MENQEGFERLVPYRTEKELTSGVIPLISARAAAT